METESPYVTSAYVSLQKIEKPLTNLLNEITISPSLATLILDSPVGDAWLPAVEELEQKMQLTGSRSRVKAAKDLAEVTEGLRIVVCPLPFPLTYCLTAMSGSHQASSFLPFHVQTHTGKRYHKSPSLTNICSHEVQTAVRFPSTTSPECRCRNTEVLFSNCADILRDWLQEIYT